MAPRNDSDDRLITEKFIRDPRFRLNECSNVRCGVIRDTVRPAAGQPMSVMPLIATEIVSR